MSIYGLTKDDILAKMNSKRKNPIHEKDIFSSEIKISLLKQIDDIFKKGLSYYIDPSKPVKSKEESIFFRKDNFNANLNFGARQIINKFEQDKISFAALTKLADFKIQREIPIYRLIDKPKEVADKVAYLRPEKSQSDKEFLSNFIGRLGDNNILVFEFVETHNKKEKANIGGFFLTPNVIVLKRNQKAYKREIFTLAHELGHYLLNEEEVDKSEGNEYDNTSEIEKWCNDFAFYFLAGKASELLTGIKEANASNDYHHDLIESISDSSHLSISAIYTRLLIDKLISRPYYDKIIESIRVDIEKREQEKKRLLEIEKEKAKAKGEKLIVPPPKPIISPLYLSTLRGALHKGVISERDFCIKLNIKPDKIDKYLTL